MSNLGHIHGDIPQTRAKSRGAEACHCTEIIHVLITLPASLRMMSVQSCSCLPSSQLWDPLSVWHSMNPWYWADTQTHQQRRFLILILSAHPSFLKHCIHQLQYWSYKASVCPWLDCLSHKQGITLLLSDIWILWLIAFAQFDSSYILTLWKAHQG